MNRNVRVAVCVLKPVMRVLSVWLTVKPGCSGKTIVMVWVTVCRHALRKRFLLKCGMPPHMMKLPFKKKNAAGRQPPQPPEPAVLCPVAARAAGFSILLLSRRILFLQLFFTVLLRQMQSILSELVKPSLPGTIEHVVMS